MASWDTGTAFQTGQQNGYAGGLKTGTPFSSEGMVYSGALGNWADSGGGTPQVARPGAALTERSYAQGLHQGPAEGRTTISQALADEPEDHDLSKYLIGSSAKRPDSVTGFKGEFATALDRFIADAPGPISINSGYRSQELQNRLFQNAVAKYGSEGAARKWVARNSNHTGGIAADLKYSSPEVRKWAHENAANYGLNFRLGHEPWHVEFAGGTGAPSPRSVPDPQPRGQGSSERMMAYTARELGPNRRDEKGNTTHVADLWGRGATRTAYAQQPATREAPFEAVMRSDPQSREVDIPNPPRRPAPPGFDVGRMDAAAPAPQIERTAPQQGGYTVQPGDNLWTIAEQTLGDGNRWQEIAQANGISDPRSLQPGTTLSMPGQSGPSEAMNSPQDYQTQRTLGGAPDARPRQRPLMQGDQITYEQDMPNPTSAPGRQVDIPNPPMRPAPRVARPAGPTGMEGSPEANLGRYSPADVTQARDDLDALRAKTGKPPMQRPPAPPVDPRDELKAIRQRQQQGRMPPSAMWDGSDPSTGNSPLADAQVQGVDPSASVDIINRVRELTSAGMDSNEAYRTAINEAQQGQPVYVSRGGVRIFAER